MQNRVAVSMVYTVSAVAASILLSVPNHLGKAERTWGLFGFRVCGQPPDSVDLRSRKRSLAGPFS